MLAQRENVSGRGLATLCASQASLDRRWKSRLEARRTPKPPSNLYQKPADPYLAQRTYPHGRDASTTNARLTPLASQLGSEVLLEMMMLRNSFDTQ